MRLFIAAEIPDDVKESLNSFQKGLSESGCRVRFTEKENLHFTLKFLGEVDKKGMEDAESGIYSTLKGFRPFSISVEGAGFFGRPERIRVVWAGVKQGRDELVKLIRSLDRNLDHIRINEHAPSPHITMARIRGSRSTANLAREVNSHERVKFGEFSLSEIVLKMSTLTEKGPIYRDLHVFPLSEVGSVQGVGHE